MKFAIITHVIHKKQGNEYFAYAPYVREMNVWGKYVTDLLVVAALESKEPTAIDSSYCHKKVTFFQIEAIDILSWRSRLRTFLALPRIAWQIFKAMDQADHIHLRCPGNIGLIGCLVQVLFPFKYKTAKYAGNWDPKVKQPWSYRLQKWILSNTFLTRNMQVLVYGEWGRSTKNIQPFFTATYSEADKNQLKVLNLKGKINFVFVGTLVSGKNPLYAIQVVESLFKKGYNVTLHLYGEGIEYKTLEHYIVSNGLEKSIILKGNQNQEAVKSAYQNSHFVLLPSQSEGWPKALAEGMFWGCVPIATPVSCVPLMLGYGERGVLLGMTLEQDVQQVLTIVEDAVAYLDKRQQAADWSRQYTLNVFEKEIQRIVCSPQ